MKITVAATNITIGETTYPLNSLYFKSNGTIISIYIFGTSGPIIQSIWSDFRTSSGGEFATIDAVMTLLKTSLVAL